ncbi:MAG: hypothetical protein ABIQ44_08160 [Chloroflexia bacterium]
MSDFEKNVVLRAALLGVMSGMRSAAGPAAMVRRMAKNPKKFEGTVFEWMANSTQATFATLAQVGEVVVDKLPFLPPRTSLQPLVVRALAGGGAGTAAFIEAEKPAPIGWVIGAACAVASSHAFYRARKGVTEATRLPDLPVALAEDGLVLAFERVVQGSYE